MKIKPSRFGLGVALAVLLAGCSTLDKRISEKSAVFDQLSPVDQRIIRNGYIAVGFTPDMVYMALDKPEKIEPGPGPNEETWIYHNFYAGSGGGGTIPTKLVVHDNGSLGGTTPSGLPGSGTAGRMPGAITGVDPVTGSGPMKMNGTTNTYTVEPDPAAEQIKADSTMKVYVKFLDGKVASINIVQT